MLKHTVSIGSERQHAHIEGYWRKHTDQGTLYFQAVMDDETNIGNENISSWKCYTPSGNMLHYSLRGGTSDFSKIYEADFSGISYIDFNNLARYMRHEKGSKSEWIYYNDFSDKKAAAKGWDNLASLGLKTPEDVAKDLKIINTGTGLEFPSNHEFGRILSPLSDQRIYDAEFMRASPVMMNHSFEYTAISCIVALPFFIKAYSEKIIDAILHKEK